MVSFVYSDRVMVLGFWSVNVGIGNVPLVFTMLRPTVLGDKTPEGYSSACVSSRALRAARRATSGP
jgi:hypothetical protein